MWKKFVQFTCTHLSIETVSTVNDHGDVEVTTRQTTCLDCGKTL